MNSDTLGLRIVSLIASSTEIVCALGLGECLVGRSHECDYPPVVRGLPLCTRPRFEITASSAAIDQNVKELLAAGEPLYAVDGALLRELRATVVITQVQCAVCAVSLKDVEQNVLPGTGAAVVTLGGTDLEGIFADILRVGEVCGVSDRAAQLVCDLRNRKSVIESRLPDRRPTVACIEWIEPLMAAGNWIPELVEAAGGTDLFGEVGKHSPTMTWEELQASDADIILVFPCGFDLAQTRREMRTMTEHVLWLSLRAVRAGRVYLLDGNQYFNRPGPRILDSLEILAEIFHPELFSFGYEDRGWERFDVTLQTAGPRGRIGAQR